MMKITNFSEQAQEGLRAWAEWQHGDAMLFDDIGGAPEQWAWITFQLRIADDRAEWFPKGKWATIQVIESQLNAEAQEAKRKPDTDPLEDEDSQAKADFLAELANEPEQK